MCVNRREERMRVSEGGQRGSKRGREILSYYETNNICDVSKFQGLDPCMYLS